MDNWLILQNFYNELTQIARDHVGAATGRAFFSLTTEKNTALIEKMVSNQGWSDDRLQPRQRGVHTVKETDMLATKIDLLLKKFEDKPQDKAQMQTLQALDARMTCEVCGNTQKPRKKLCISMGTTMGFVHKEVRGGINHTHIIKEVMEIQILSILTDLP
jgi:hypothetical protein